jgi:hypothetical protein
MIIEFVFNAGFIRPEFELPFLQRLHARRDSRRCGPAEWLRAAADQGDEQALLTLDELGAEAKAKEKAALFKLRALASNDDARARTLLEQLEAERHAGSGIVV